MVVMSIVCLYFKKKQKSWSLNCPGKKNEKQDNGRQCWKPFNPVPIFCFDMLLLFES